VNDPYLSLIIPAFNEEKRLPKTLQLLAEFVDSQKYSIEVLVIENGSTDNTFDVAKNICEMHKVFELHHIEGKGKGLAVRFGMLRAKGQYRMMLDADLSMPVDQIRRFFPPQSDGHDIVIASREAPGAIRYREPQYRHLGGRLVNLLIRFLVLPGLQDSQCGFKCFRADVADDLFRVQQMGGWSFDVEVLYVARLRGYKVEELAIPWYFNEESHVSPVRDTLRMLFDLLAIRAKARNGDYEPAL
jgi:dolichyl-phosphate beta-glucosyltransferase